MLIPAPLPTYTLAPGLPDLRTGQQHALEAALGGLTGRVHGVVVTAVGTTLSHHVIELLTGAGRRPPGRRRGIGPAHAVRLAA